MSIAIPAHLRGYEALYREDPRKASLAWFQDAKYGLFVHYGLYSMPGRGEWVMYHEKIHVSEYEKLKTSFTAEQFDAEAIADLAVAAEMKYVSFTTRHHDSFSLFRTGENDFNSVQSPAGRDLVGELAEACRKRGLGLFLYYSYGTDWRHPYFLPNEAGTHSARPRYSEPEPFYKYEQEADFAHYIAFMHRQLEELLTQYGPVAGVWFDLISACYYRPELFPVQDTYALIRRLQPHCLISFKQGVTGDEDYMSQEIKFVPLKERLEKGGASPEAVELSERIWRMHAGKRNEICTILQDKGWGYIEGARHKTKDEVLDMLAVAAGNNCNLLLNTGPLGDGSLHPGDERTLREVGEHIRQFGFPAAKADGQAAGETETGAGAV